MLRKILILICFIVSTSVFSAQILKTKDSGAVLIKMSANQELFVGDKVYVLNNFNEKRAMIIIVKVKGRKALGKVKKTLGGFRVKKGQKVTLKNVKPSKRDNQDLRPKRTKVKYRDDSYNDSYDNYGINPNYSSGKTVWISVDPLAMLFGVLNATVDIKVANNLSLGGLAGYLSKEDGVSVGGVATVGSKTTATQFGVIGRYYMDGAINQGVNIALMGAMVSGEVTSGSSSSLIAYDDGVTTSTTKLSGTYFGFLGSYLWTWDLFAISAGAGYGIYSLTAKYEDSSGNTEYETGVPMDGGNFILSATLGLVF